MTQIEVRAAIARERRELAAVLDALSPPDWDRPTLCAGWQVRHLVAHMTMPSATGTAGRGRERTIHRSA